MESPPNLPKSLSQALIPTINKELKKILPTGASQNKRFKIPKSQTKKQSILEKRRFTLEEQEKYMNPALMRYLETHFKVLDLKSESPFKLPETIRRAPSPKIPNKTPLSLSPSPIVRRKSLKRVLNEDLSEPKKNINQKFSQNVGILEGIMSACDEVTSPRHPVSGKVVKKYTQHVKKFVEDMEDYFSRPQEAFEIEPWNNKGQVETGGKEFEAKDVVMKMVKERIEEKNQVKALKTKALPKVYKNELS